ncbi:alpha-L-fucosidase [bacterium]|nr:alpha-L-fucosidase [bacterium]
MKKWLCILIAGILMACCGRKTADRDYLHETEAERSERMAWWREARFGLFIHWGLYAVPAGKYKGEEVWGTGEWIMNSAPIPVPEYEAYAARFNPVHFNADEWAGLAADAGMKYLVITSKHHDGFCLWDSKISGYDVMDRTPFKRDILRELSEACRRRGIRFCLYHSIMDWHHPDAQGIFYPAYNTSKTNPGFQRYVDTYLKPQLEELVSGYGPLGVLWFDGQWINDWTLQTGRDLYRFVRSLQPDIIVNNRVGKGGTGLSGRKEESVGDFGTPEQEIPPQGLLGVDWESCMTMNDTWGFRESDLNWKSDTTLIWNLAETASKGGNFLLNVGPTAQGLIPQASVDRLHRMGQWLRINGEAIYRTRECQIPEQGKNLRFTQSPDGGTVYALYLGRPGRGVKIKGLPLLPDSQVFLLGHEKPLQWKCEGDALNIEIPQPLAENPPGFIAHTFRISVRPMVEKPRFSQDQKISLNEPIFVALESPTPGASIHYTLDGSIPDESSPLYGEPVVISRSGTLMARAFKHGMAPSTASETSFSILDSTANGMTYALYEGEWSSLPDFGKLKPVRTGETWSFDPAGIRPGGDHFGIVFKGRIQIPENGAYTFFIKSDDGSLLRIGGKPVAVNDGLHGPVEAQGSAAFLKGLHNFELGFFEATGGEALEVSVEGPGMRKQPLPPHWLIR